MQRSLVLAWPSVTIASVLRIAGVCALSFAVLQFVGTLWLQVHQSLVDLPLGRFRQTQTAVAVHYALQEGAWLANVIPVFGAPWVLPIEFPLFQWMVALTTSSTGMSIDSAGRLVSAGFTLATLWPIRSLCRSFSLGDEAFIAASTLWLLAPVVTLWGSAFLIESLSVFLGVAWLASYIRWMKTNDRLALGVCTALGIIAVLVKATTFFGFGVCAAFYTIHAGWQEKSAAWMFKTIAGGVGVTVGVVGMMIWLRYSDWYLSQNPIAPLIGFRNLKAWYFATWGERWGQPLWQRTIQYRALHEALGYAWPILLLGAGLAWRAWRLVAIAVVCLLTYVGCFVMFPRLHMNHHYYQMENALFLVLAAALIAEALRRSIGLAAGAFLLAVLGISQVHSFYTDDKVRSLLTKSGDNQIHRAALVVRERIPLNSVVVVVGLDWGSEVPYYSQRRGIVLANWLPEPLVREVVFTNRAKWLEGRPIGALVDCAVGPFFKADGHVRAVANQLIEELGSSAIEIENCRVYFVDR